MKKSLFIICLLFAFFQFMVVANANNPEPKTSPRVFEAGATATVYASSGLTLRMHPHKTSEALLVIPFGDPVTILNNVNDTIDHADQIAWMDGQWTFVDYYGLQGYIFDGFISNLPLPNHESEMCGDCSHLIYPFDQYLDDHFSVTKNESMSNQSEVVTQFVQTLDQNIKRKKSFTDSWFHLEVTMEKVRVGDVLNLFRSMITNKNYKNEFEQSLVFKTNGQGQLSSVKIGMYDKPIRLFKLPNGSVKITSTVVYTEDGC